MIRTYLIAVHNWIKLINSLEAIDLVATSFFPFLVKVTHWDDHLKVIWILRFIMMGIGERKCFSNDSLEVLPFNLTEEAVANTGLKSI